MLVEVASPVVDKLCPITCILFFVGHYSQAIGQHLRQRLGWPWDEPERPDATLRGLAALCLRCGEAR